MKNIADQVENCNGDSTASTQNNVAVVESAFDESIPNSGSEEEEDITLMLSRELALDINPKRADLTASFILYGLYTWQVSKRKAFVYNPTINGKPAAYRSVRELEEEYPWLRHNSILKALRRAEKKLNGEFIMQVVKRNEQDQLIFLLSDKLSKKYKFDLAYKQPQFSKTGERLSSKRKREKSGLISFQKNDAIKYGTMGAILVNNLRHVLVPERNTAPLEDAVGNIYRELSPTALTKPVKNEKGEMKAPLPVSPDTITRTLNDLKTNRVFHEHPLENNFYTLASTMKPLEGSAAKVNTLAAKVTTSAAKVTTESEVVRCNHEHMNDIQLLFETSDSNRDRNTDRKCVITQSVSLRETDCVDDVDEAFVVRKNILLSASDEAIRLSAQRNSLEVPRFDIRDYAVYHVEDADKVHPSYYELPYEIILHDPNTGKPYSRIAELNYMTAEIAASFRSLKMPYTKTELDGIQALFEQHPLLTVENVQDLLTFGVDFGTGELPDAPAKGHDFYYFRRRVKTAKQFLHYLPQLVREKHFNERYKSKPIYHPVTKLPMFDYSWMEEPFVSIAFADDKVPVTWEYFTVEEEMPELGTVLHGGTWHEFLTGKNVMVETMRVKPVSYAEYMSDDYDWAADRYTYGPWKPGYDEMLRLPVLYDKRPEPVQFGCVEFKNWERKNGKAQFLDRTDCFA